MSNELLIVNKILLQRAIEKNPQKYTTVKAVLSNPKGFISIIEKLDEAELAKTTRFLDEFKREMSIDLIDANQAPLKAGQMELWLQSLIKSVNSKDVKSPVIYA